MEGEMTLEEGVEVVDGEMLVEEGVELGSGGGGDI